MSHWNIPRQAALLAVCFLLISSGAHATVLPENNRKIEVAFVLDTTGSMSGLIDGAKKKIWSIANNIVDQYTDAEIKIGLVGYRDIGDEYVVKYYPLTTDIQGIYGHLLGFQADGGGDTPESVNEALDIAVSKLEWSPVAEKVDRILFLVGDAPPHMDYKQDRKYPDVIKEAGQKKIIVNTVLAGNSQETKKVWQKMASLGKGEFLAIPQDGGRVIVIKTPYDEPIHRIQIELNTTIIPYGNAPQQAAVASKAEMYASAPAESAAEMSKFVSKKSRGKAAVTGRGDLVNDISDGSFSGDLSAIPAKELPKPMQAMNTEERKTYVAEQSTKREKLSKDLAEQTKLRDEYIAAEMAKKPEPKPADSFDSTVTTTLQMQLSH